MTTSDHKWSPITANDHQQPPIITNDHHHHHQWLPTTTNGHQRPPLTTNDFQRPPMTTNDHQWPPMTTNAHHWPTTTIDQCPLLIIEIVKVLISAQYSLADVVHVSIHTRSWCPNKRGTFNFISSENFEFYAPRGEAAPSGDKPSPHRHPTALLPGFKNPHAGFYSNWGIPRQANATSPSWIFLEGMTFLFASSQSQVRGTRANQGWQQAVVPQWRPCWPLLAYATDDMLDLRGHLSAGRVGVETLSVQGRPEDQELCVGLIHQ